VDDADALDPPSAVDFGEVFREHSIVIAPTHFSTTAPLKLAAPRWGFRAATMPGFSRDMIPALKLDYEEIHRRVVCLKALLDEATGADFLFCAEGRELTLHLDLRFRAAHASGGLVREPGQAGNLPSGETYIVPYEGERSGDPSLSRGTLPVELDGEVVFYTIRENKAVGVEVGGTVAGREAELLGREPAYGNLAELGLGVLADFGVKPIGRILLDEKLGLHIAFGRSDHFGGQVGAAHFSRPEAVVHIDRVYLPETQPRVHVRRVDLTIGGELRPLMADGVYLDGVFS
jgi:leucyl aminopeptidase (aminopeptidase T)